jgi:putative membrane protein
MQPNKNLPRGLRTLVLIVLGALALAIVAGLTLTHAAMPNPSTWGWHSGMMTGGHMTGWGWGLLFGGLWMAALLALPLYLVYWLTTARGTRTDSGEPDAALATLREQYARGDIDDEEFDHRRSRLDSER